MSIKVKVDYLECMRSLDRLATKQIPFAVAKSLTDLAKIGQSAVRANLDKKFKLRARSFIIRNIKITPAKKSDAQRYIAFSAVRTDPKISNFMVGHEKGAIRRPQQSKQIAVPSTDLVAKAYRKSGGGVKTKYLPRVLLKEFKGVRGSRGSQTRSRSRKPFIIHTKGGGLIVRRRSKKRFPLELLYIFRKKVSIKEHWGFAKTVKGITQFKAKQVFKKNLALAINSAH